MSSSGVQASTIKVVNIIEDVLDDAVSYRSTPEGTEIDVELRGFEVKTFKLVTL